MLSSEQIPADSGLHSKLFSSFQGVPLAPSGKNVPLKRRGYLQTPRSQSWGRWLRPVSILAGEGPPHVSAAPPDQGRRPARGQPSAHHSPPLAPSSSLLNANCVEDSHAYLHFQVVWFQFWTISSLNVSLHSNTPRIQLFHPPPLRIAHNLSRSGESFRENHSSLSLLARVYLLWGCNFFSIMSPPGYNLSFQKEVTQMVYFPRILTTDPGRLSQLLKSAYVSKDKFLHRCFTWGAHAKLFVYQGCTGFRGTSYIPPSVAMNCFTHWIKSLIEDQVPPASPATTLFHNDFLMETILRLLVGS